MRSTSHRSGTFCENDKTRTMKRIAIQGIKGSYHDMAAINFFHNGDIEAYLLLHV